ncbi:FkbM family methyltransferase [Thermodesulfobacteriota bacterium]
MKIKKQFVGLAKPLVDKFPRVALAYRAFRDQRRLSDDPVATPMGFKMIGNPEMGKGSFEPEETEIVKHLLKHAEVCINVGANIGYYSCLALKHGNYTLAFEPIGTNLEYLYRNIRANHWEKSIEIFPIALSNQVGIIEIFGGGTGASLIKGWAGTPEHYVNMVPTSTLDNILGQRFSNKRCLIIVDIEGAEKFMLEGATSILSRELKPIWLVEISISEHQPQGVTINPNLLSTFRFFWDRGYEARTADKRLHFVQPDEIESIVESGEDTLTTHNFLFIEKGRKKEFLDIQAS